MIAHCSESTAVRFGPVGRCAAADVDFAHIPRLVRENAARWQPVLQRTDVATRPDDRTWSALEYAAHVRDVFRIFDERLALMLAGDDPAFPNWDQDATADTEGCNEQVPAVRGPRTR